MSHDANASRFRDAIGDAVADAHRHFDEPCHICGADEVLAMPEMQAIRKALQQAVRSVAVDFGVSDLDVMTDGHYIDPLPPSVLAWVMGENP
jgi:hypothetical protein